MRRKGKLGVRVKGRKKKRTAACLLYPVGWVSIKTLYHSLIPMTLPH